jgi:diguanylate cyclase (GGDEF)-like protein
MKDPRVVEIEFLSGLENNPPSSVAPWEWEESLGVSRQFFLDMVYGLFLDRCLEGVSSILPPAPTNPYGGTFERWGDFQRNNAVASLLQHTSFAAYVNHKGRVRLWQLRDEVQKARTKEKFGILYDRQPFESDVTIDLAMKDQTRSSAVLFMDLDHFKSVNDNVSHAVGDDILRIFFQTVLKLTAGRGVVYGWGGDEVVVFLKEIDPQAAEALVDVIKKTVADDCSAQPDVAAKNLAITVSCGTYVFKGRESPAAIVDAADKLMYLDKEKMKGPPSPK